MSVKSSLKGLNGFIHGLVGTNQSLSIASASLQFQASLLWRTQYQGTISETKLLPSPDFEPANAFILDFSNLLRYKV